MKIVLEPIGIIRTPFKKAKDAPRQAAEALMYTAVAEIFPPYREALEGLDSFPWVVLIYFLHRTGGRGDLKGVFSTRSPHRPNPLGVAVVELLEVKEDSIRFRGVDMLDGTPLLDIKPYYPTLVPSAPPPPEEPKAKIAPPPPLTPGRQ